MIRKESRALTWRLSGSQGGNEEAGAKQQGAGGKVQETLLGEWSVLGEGLGEGLQMYRVWQREDLRVMLGVPVSLMG